MENAKILIGCPTSDHKRYCIQQYLEGVKNIDYDNYDFVLVDNSQANDYIREIESYGVKVVKSKYVEPARVRIMESRNLLRKMFLEGDYDYFFSLEQDVVPPKDVLKRLISQNKEVISGVYYNIFTNPQTGQQQMRPLVWVSPSEEELEEIKLGKKGPVPQQKLLSGEWKREDMTAQLSVEEVRESKLIEARMTGIGCMLIKRNVLEKIQFRHGEGGFDDVYFCDDIISNGWKVMVDTSVKCEHLVQPGAWGKIKY